MMKGHVVFILILICTIPLSFSQSFQTFPSNDIIDASALSGYTYPISNIIGTVPYLVSAFSIIQQPNPIEASFCLSTFSNNTNFHECQSIMSEVTSQAHSIAYDYISAIQILTKQAAYTQVLQRALGLSVPDDPELPQTMNVSSYIYNTLTPMNLSHYSQKLVGFGSWLAASRNSTPSLTSLATYYEETYLADPFFWQQFSSSDIPTTYSGYLRTINDMLITISSYPELLQCADSISLLLDPSLDGGSLEKAFNQSLKEQEWGFNISIPSYNIFVLNTLATDMHFSTYQVVSHFNVTAAEQSFNSTLKELFDPFSAFIYAYELHESQSGNYITSYIEALNAAIVEGSNYSPATSVTQSLANIVASLNHYLPILADIQEDIKQQIFEKGYFLPTFNVSTELLKEADIYYTEFWDSLIIAMSFFDDIEMHDFLFNETEQPSLLNMIIVASSLYSSNISYLSSIFTNARYDIAALYSLVTTLGDRKLLKLHTQGSTPPKLTPQYGICSIGLALQLDNPDDHKIPNISYSIHNDHSSTPSKPKKSSVYEDNPSTSSLNVMIYDVFVPITVFVGLAVIYLCLIRRGKSKSGSFWRKRADKQADSPETKHTLKTVDTDKSADMQRV